MRSFLTTIFAVFVAGPILFFIQGWSISTLWNWFIAPLGTPQIGIATALGISRRQRLERLIGYFLVPVIGVGIGWVVLQFA